MIFLFYHADEDRVSLNSRAHENPGGHPSTRSGAIPVRVEPARSDCSGSTLPGDCTLVKCQSRKRLADHVYMRVGSTNRRADRELTEELLRSAEYDRVKGQQSTLLLQFTRSE